jgi:hypothetical protein
MPAHLCERWPCTSSEKYAIRSSSPTGVQLNLQGDPQVMAASEAAMIDASGWFCDDEVNWGLLVP